MFSDQHIWVTAYTVSGRRDLLVTQTPQTSASILFSFDAQGIAYPVSVETLYDYRASGAVTTFYAMPNPF